jgi:hypothetical protein
MCSKHPIQSNDNIPAPPCWVPEEKVEEARERVTRWVPVLVATLIAIGSNAIFVSYLFGKMEQRIVPVEEHVRTDTTERLLQLFITRTEFHQRTDTRDREMADMKATLREMNNKIDRLLERPNGSKE